MKYYHRKGDINDKIKRFSKKVVNDNIKNKFHFESSFAYEVYTLMLKN